MKNLNPENWEYRVKCRQCGKKCDYFFSERKQIMHIEFVKAMLEKLQYPAQYDCKKCKEHTIHDVIAYSHLYDDP